MRARRSGRRSQVRPSAEENLLKLAELRGTLDAEQAARWEQIKADFRRNKAIGGADSDTGTRVVAQLRDLSEGLQGLRTLAEEQTRQAISDSANGSAGARSCAGGAVPMAR